MTRPVTQQPVGILGGTGPLGGGLAARWCQAGLPVVIGSREAARARQSAERLSSSLARGASLEDCAEASDIVVLAVPWSAHAATIKRVRDRLSGKIVVDVVVPLAFDADGPLVLPVGEGSAAEQAQKMLPECRVVAAFHHVSAAILADAAKPTVDMDVLVLGDERASVDRVRELAEAIPGVRGVAAGRLRNARQVEGLTANLISINKRYKTHAGIAVTNLRRP